MTAPNPAPPAEAEIVEIMARACCDALYPNAWNTVRGAQRDPWLAEARAALTALRRAGLAVVPEGWQPIETVQRTKERRLFWSPGNPNAGNENARGPCQRVDWYRLPSSARAWSEYPEAPYTHWRPLPPPPIEEGAQP